MKKMQAGGTKTYKGSKGATTIKKQSGNVIGPDVITTHKGKQGATTKTNNDFWKNSNSVTHKGNKGVTKKGPYQTTHSGKTGTTQKMPNGTIAHSNSKGYTSISTDSKGNKEVTYLSKKPKASIYTKTIKPKKK